MALTRAVDMLGAQLGAKVDQVVSMQIQLVRLQEQQTQTGNALGRAFQAIEAVQKKADTCDTNLTRAMSFVKGSMLVATLLFAFIQWYALGHVHDAKASSEKIAVIERRLSLIDANLGRDWTTGAK